MNIHFVSKVGGKILIFDKVIAVLLFSEVSNQSTSFFLKRFIFIVEVLENHNLAKQDTVKIHDSAPRR